MKNLLLLLILTTIVACTSSMHAQLRVVNEIQTQIKTTSYLIIFGAPGSGKTEQLEMALSEQPYQIFDLRNSFISAYANEHHITDPKELDKLKKIEYAKLKAHERHWLHHEKDKIIQDLKKNSAHIIIFDEFDLWVEANPTKDELESAKIVLHIAKNIGKTAIFILHDNGLNSQELQNEFAQKLHINTSQVISTGYFTEEEEDYLLQGTALTTAEKVYYKTWTLGDPSGYLTILENLAKHQTEAFQLATLKAAAMTTVQKVYKVIKTTAPSSAVILHQIASGKSAISDYDQKTLNHLLGTGLIGLKNGLYVMPPLVKEEISIH